MIDTIKNALMLFAAFGIQAAFAAALLGGFVLGIKLVSYLTN